MLCDEESLVIFTLSYILIGVKQFLVNLGGPEGFSLVFFYVLFWISSKHNYKQVKIFEEVS